MKPCARCGLTKGQVIDLDTGSACHAELWECIQHLKQSLELAQVQRQFAVDLLRVVQGLPPAKGHGWLDPDDPPINDP